MRYRMLIEYDGTGYHGWQIQPNCETIQETIEDALHTVLRIRIGIVGSGRTDAGVHARGQVAHFDLPEAVDLFKLRRSLNGVLPMQISILKLEKTQDEFHARYDARMRRYFYHISTEKRPLSVKSRYIVRFIPDFDVMNQAARQLLGTYDCSTFCRVQSETINRVCTIQEAQWEKETYAGDWVFKISADRFLHGMVRAIVGTLLEVGGGKRTVAGIAALLDSRDRTKAGPAAPPHGLVLETVAYQE